MVVEVPAALPEEPNQQSKNNSIASDRMGFSLYAQLLAV